MSTSKKAQSEAATPEGLPICGLIMPISATASHTEVHWSEVQILLHRAVKAAGFEARNVWENSSKDRVSERIIANIFEYPLVIADISDLNPNVMLELGLRLASKKPTIVVVNKGGVIPFDIRDFHVIDYPPDLNILGIERFFERISNSLKEKYDNYREDKYEPFLGKVVVDVISPEHREVSLDQALVDKLDDILARLSGIEGRSKREPSNSIRGGRLLRSGRKLFFTGGADPSEAMNTMSEFPGVDKVELLGFDGDTSHISVAFSDVLNGPRERAYLSSLAATAATLGWLDGIDSDSESRYNI